MNLRRLEAMIVGYLLQKGVHKTRKQRKFKWNGERLVKMT